MSGMYSQSMNSTMNSTMGSSAGFRKSVSNLEVEFDQHQITLEEIRKTINSLSRAQSESRSALDLLKKDMNMKFNSELDKLITTTDQKFSVQTSENKNFQYQLQSTKKVLSNISEIDQSLKNRVERVERELQ